MKKILVIILALLSNYVAIAQLYDSDLELALALQGQNKYEEAIVVYTDVIREDSINWVPWANRGICYASLKDFKNAKLDFERAILLAPNEPNLNLAIADFYGAILEPELALYHYKNALNNQAYFDALSYYNYGTIFFMEGNTDSAIIYLEKSWALDSTNSDVVNNLGWSYLDTEPQKACVYFNEAYLIDSLDASNVNNLGYSHLMCGDLEIAYSYFEKSEQIDSTNSFVYRNYGLYYMYKNEKELACENMRKSIDLGIEEKWGTQYIIELKQYCEGE